MQPLKVEYGDQFGFYHEPMLIRAPLLYDRGREWPQLAADDACLTPEGSYCKVLSLGDSEWELHIQELYPESRNIRVVRQELLQRLPRVGEIARVRSLPLADVQWLMIRHGGVSYGMSLLLGCVGVVEGTFVMGGSTFVRMLGHAWSPQMLEPATPREVATGLARPTMALHTHGSTAYLKVEDNVRIKPVSVVDARKLQRDHGGWNNRMASLIGTIGSVTKVWPNRTDSSGSTWMAAVEGLCWNPALLERMNKQGDFVSVLPANTSPIDGFLNAWDFAEDGLDSGDAEISESAKTTIEFTFEAKTPLGLRVRKIDGGVAGGNLVVSSVLVGGLAAAQQVRVGDWIATLNGKPVDATTSAACFVDHVRAANRPFSIGMLRLHRLEVIYSIIILSHAHVQSISIDQISLIKEAFCCYVLISLLYGLRWLDCLRRTRLVSLVCAKKQTFHTWLQDCRSFFASLSMLLAFKLPMLNTVYSAHLGMYKR
jgi:hypothetical protein